MSEHFKLIQPIENIIDIQKILYIPDILDEHIIPYVSTTIANCHIDYTETSEDELDREESEELLEMHKNELLNILTNMTKIIIKFNEIKIRKEGFSTILLDLNNSWYENERYIVEKVSNITFDNIKISKIMTICCKIIDFLSEHTLNKINYFERIIMRIKHDANEQMEGRTLTLREQQRIKSILKLRINKITELKNASVEKLKIIDNHSKPIQQYFLEKLMMNDLNYLAKTPITVLNIFQSSLYLVKNNIVENNFDFINLVLEFKEWMPTEYRSLYYGIYVVLSTNPETRYITNNKSPNVKLLLTDIETLYWKSTKNPEILYDGNCFMGLIMLLNGKLRRTIYLDISDKKYISFVSLSLTLISKYCENKKTENSNTEIFVALILNLLQLIHKILENVDLLNSFLIYKIPSILLGLYEMNFEDKPEIIDELNRIFIIYNLNSSSLNYLASILDEKKIDTIPLLPEQKANLLKNIKYYKHIYDNVSDEDVYDGISSTVIIEPYVLPMNIDKTYTGMCDKNVIETCIWDTKTNPFTRSPIDIETLADFNMSEENIEKRRNTRVKLSEILESVKKEFI